MLKQIYSLVGLGLLVGCATQPLPEPVPYLPIHRPVQAPLGGIVAYPTAALRGRLDVMGDCFILVSLIAVPTLVSYSPEVRVVYERGQWGLQNRTGKRVMQGEKISVGGSGSPDPELFLSTRLISSTPPATCPTSLFVSNSSFSP